MIRVIKRTHTGLPCGEVLEILADTEADILALGDVVNDGFDSVKVGPGSIVHVAGFGPKYEMSPSRVWTKEGQTLDVVPCVTDADGAILTDENNNIILM